MKIQIDNNYNKMSKRAAKIVSAQINFKPDSVLCLPTGSTPLKMYDYLSEFHYNNELNFEEVNTFDLDELLNIPSNHHRSSKNYMYKNLFSRINIPEENTHIPQSNPKNPRVNVKDMKNKLIKMED